MGSYAAASKSLRILIAALFTSQAVAADEVLPWRQPESVPLPARIQSVEFPKHDEPVYRAPGSKDRRGAVRLGARLPIFAVQPSQGACPNRWFLVGPNAWVCEDRVRLTDWPPISPEQTSSPGDGLPYAYHFVSQDGSFGYESLSLAEEGIPDSQLEPGFAVAIRQVQNKPGGELFGLTTHDLWLPMRDLRPARRSEFQGLALNDADQAAAWVNISSPRVYSSPGRLLPRSKRPKLARLLDFSPSETKTRYSQEYLSYAEGQWLNRRDVRMRTPAPLPAGLAAEERWLDIDLDEQVLTAYVGRTPVFATLVSTGRGAQGQEQATPKGEHRIWVKLLSTDMTNLENANASRYYAIEDVPYVMFFKGGYGLHGAFWHESFGNKRSHGCVNLSPRDAQFLFDWTGPRLPAGWHAVLPSPHDPGTRVVVR